MGFFEDKDGYLIFTSKYSILTEKTYIIMAKNGGNQFIIKFLLKKLIVKSHLKSITRNWEHSC